MSLFVLWLFFFFSFPAGWVLDFFFLPLLLRHLFFLFTALLKILFLRIYEFLQNFRSWVFNFCVKILLRIFVFTFCPVLLFVLLGWGTMNAKERTEKHIRNGQNCYFFFFFFLEPTYNEKRLDSVSLLVSFHFYSKCFCVFFSTVYVVVVVVVGLLSQMKNLSAGKITKEIFSGKSNDYGIGTDPIMKQ